MIILSVTGAQTGEPLLFKPRNDHPSGSLFGTSRASPNPSHHLLYALAHSYAEIGLDLVHWFSSRVSNFLFCRIDPQKGGLHHRHRDNLASKSQTRFFNSESISLDPMTRLGTQPPFHHCLFATIPTNVSRRSITGSSSRCGSNLFFFFH